MLQEVGTIQNAETNRERSMPCQIVSSTHGTHSVDLNLWETTKSKQGVVKAQDTKTFLANTYKQQYN